MKNLFLLPTLLLCVAACDAPVDQFRPNVLRATSLASARRVDSVGNAAADAAAVCQQWFGTPEQPRWPTADTVGSAAAKLVRVESLRHAAGPISSDQDDVQRGLYRKHCVVCHAIEGNGAGPAALFQNPYPRNFSLGIFKWKSTVRSAKPVRDDLLTVLHQGLPGSSMPQFTGVDTADLQTLTDYVIYLSVRGEVERGLIAAAVDELNYGGDENPDLKLAQDPGTEGGDVANEVLREVLAAWVTANEQVVAVPAFEQLEPRKLAESVAAGRAIFNGQIAACSGCHGVDGRGGVPMLDYDDWAKDYTTRAGIDPKDETAMAPLKKLGALSPRLANPRDLRDGVYRGGGDPDDLYRRITQGIAGTPMPAVAVVERPAGMGLTNPQLADLIRYVRSIGGQYENGEASGDELDRVSTIRANRSRPEVLK